jgi:predicted transcriptional regulator of viral defense system
MSDSLHPTRINLPPSVADGVLRARDLARMGLSRQRIQRLLQQGALVRVGRGLYSRPDAAVTENHTLAQVCARVPHGVICLLSALQFHHLTTQNPWQVWLLVESHARTPKLDYPPLRIFRASGEAFTAGVAEHEIESVVVRVTNIAKTVADCFKYRNKVGLDVALEALRECLRYRRATVSELTRYARICRVERVMRPYLEAMQEAFAA